MGEVLLKTHLIIRDTHEEFYIDWCGKIADTRPKFKNGKPIFVVTSRKCRLELNTTDMSMIEDCAKRMTNPKGRKAVTTDEAQIYIMEEDGKETLLGVLTHNHVKTYAPMYDKIGVV